MPALTARPGPPARKAILIVDDHPVLRRGLAALTVLVASRRVLGGERYMSAGLEARLAARYVGEHTLATDSPLHVLSDRELQVFRLIGQGRRTRQIADTLHLSIKTIESHCEHIKRKLGLESAAELG
jgi:DNA-binding NarL/FixJ family response regulator